MGLKAANPAPSSGPAVNANSAESSGINTEISDELPNTQIRNFMMALGAQDNINVQQDSTVRPGAVLIRASSNVPENDSFTDLNEDAATVPAVVPIVAQLAPESADIEAMMEERWAARIAQETEERTRQQMTEASGLPLVNDDDIVVHSPDDVEDGRPLPVQKKRCAWITAILLLFFLGGVAVFVVLSDNEDKQVDGLEVLSQSDAPSGKPSYAPSFSPVPIDPLVEELRSWIAPTREDLLRFLDPTSPQSQALVWLHDDPITLSPGRPTQTVLERYVLAVLYYSTSGQSWKFDYLSDDDACAWNNGVTNDSESLQGVYCIEGGESVGTLALSENKLRGTFPWELVLLTHLEVLDISLNSLTGSIPTRISDLTNLEFIHFYANALTGTIPSQISELTRLEVFEVYGNELSGRLPSTLSPLTTKIDLSMNSLTGFIPESWGATMPLLEKVLLNDNRLTGSLPSAFGRFPSLQDLSIQMNMLTGSLPTTFPASAIFLNLDTNLFSGSIPSTWGNMSMPNLTHFSCSENSLTGTIPSSLFDGIPNLVSFVSGDNYFSGPLPRKFSASLTALHLHDNALTGPIPSTWGDTLPNLSSLTIHGNILTGSIPLSLGQISPLTSFAFNSNSFTGSMDFLCDGRAWTSLQADCPVLVTCSCCNSTACRNA